MRRRRLPLLVGEPADQGGRLVAAEVPAQRGVVALLQNAGPRHLPRIPPPPIRHTQPVRCPLPSAVEQATANDEGSACRALSGLRHQMTTAADGAAHGICSTL